MTLEQMKAVDVRTVEAESLIDAANIKIDMDLPKLERMKESARQLGNPYCFKCGKVIVKLGYADTTATIDDRMEGFMRSL